MFLYSRWLRLPLPTRVAIAKELGISKTGSTHVQDNVVVSDGYNIETVEAALERHEDDWDEIVARAEGRTSAEPMTTESSSAPMAMTDSITSVDSKVQPMYRTQQPETPKKKTRAATKPRRKGK